MTSTPRPMSSAQTSSMIGIPASAIPALHQALGRGRSGAEAADSARRLGFAMGPALLEAFQVALDRDGIGDARGLAAESFWSRLSEFFADAGWGELSFEPLHPGVALVSSTGWAEASGVKARHPACHITTGMLASLMSEIADTRLAVLETECRAAGGDRCAFLIGSEAALQTVYSGIREGRPYAEAVAALA